ncbi:MAG: response regulator [Bacteroidetes bacterium]|nr:response regulator [Bacteroidota bacterium]
MSVPFSFSNREILIPDYSDFSVIIVEDDFYCYEYQRIVLNKTGIHIRHATNGFQLMEFLDKSLPDIILLDLQLPEMDGYDCLKEIRMRGLTFKIIVQSASDLLEDRMRMLQAGADRFINKPVLRRDLFSLMNKLLIPNGINA